MRAYGWSHEQYMDTPHEARDWLLHIDREVRQHEAEQKRAAEQRG